MNLYSSTQANGDNTHRTVSAHVCHCVKLTVCVCLECNSIFLILQDTSSCDDVLQDHTPHIPTSNSKEALSKDRYEIKSLCLCVVLRAGQRCVNMCVMFSLAHRPKEPSHGQIDDVDELSLIDHNDIMDRITLKAEVIMLFRKVS